jgi:hypothetical protein
MLRPTTCPSPMPRRSGTACRSRTLRRRPGFSARTTGTRAPPRTEPGSAHHDDCEKLVVCESSSPSLSCAHRGCRLRPGRAPLAQLRQCPFVDPASSYRFADEFGRFVREDRRPDAAAQRRAQARASERRLDVDGRGSSVHYDIPLTAANLRAAVIAGAPGRPTYMSERF